MEKGQVTLFIMLGLVILFLFIFTIQIPNLEEVDTVNLESTKLMVESCLQSIIETGIYDSGLNSEALSLYVENELLGCVEFNNSLYDVRAGDVVANVTVFQESILAKVKYPLSISNDESSGNLEYFHVEFPLSVSGVNPSVLTTTDMRAKLFVPSGISSSEQELSAKVVDIYNNNEGILDDVAYDFGPDGTKFNNPVYIVIKYGELPDNVIESDLAVAYLDGDTWVRVPSIVGPDLPEVTGVIEHFSKYAISTSPWQWRGGCGEGYWVNVNTGENVGVHPPGAPISPYVTGEKVPWGADPATGLRPCGSGGDTWRAHNDGEYCGSNSHCVSGNCQNHACVGGATVTAIDSATNSPSGSDTTSSWQWRGGCGEGYWVNVNTGASTNNRPAGAPISQYLTGEKKPWGANPATGLRPCN